MFKKLTRKNKVYYLSPLNETFEEAYITIRQKEDRVLTDTEVMSLPHLPMTHPLREEWQKRAFTVRKITNYLSNKTPKRILDLGCGNGWFTNILAQVSGAEVVGVDVNATELEQAARLFDSKYCSFIYGDIFSSKWAGSSFDLITINACIQYFPDLDQLLRQLSRLLTPEGTIHILDSPFYKIEEITLAQQRTEYYYKQKDVAAMIPFYHHHSWEGLKKYKPTVLYQPSSLLNKVAGKFNKHRSPFPWMMLSK